MAVLISAILSTARATFAYGQAIPAAVQPIRISAFAGITATDTGLASGKNGGVTAGLDVSVLPLFRLYPSAELRGNYPVHEGNVDGQKSVLGGLTIAAHLGRFRPYGDFLFGRGEIAYAPSVQKSHTNVFYTQSTSNILSPGGGLDLSLNSQWDMKLDIQVQHWASPVTSTGHQYATAGTVGITYHFNFNHAPH